MVGEALSGLLLGEPIWTNAIYAFDSQGMVELLGAVSRAFNQVNTHFLPLQMSVFPGDKDSFSKATKPRGWESFDEILLRAYAHRLRKASRKDLFILSALPNLNKDVCRRQRIAKVLKKLAGRSWDPGDIPSLKPDEEPHFTNLWAIDQFLRSRTQIENGSKGPVPFNPENANTPIRQNRNDWDRRYSKDSPIKNLGGFAREAVRTGQDHPLRDHHLFQESVGLLAALADDSEHGKTSCFQNRSVFRQELRHRGCSESQYRILVELVDAQYNLTQYTELSWGGRDVTSPASDSRGSQIGEFWAQSTTKALRSSASSMAFEFVNRVQTVTQTSESSSPPPLQMDGVFTTFAHVMASPDHGKLLREYHHWLHQARSAEALPSPDVISRLTDHTHVAVDMVNNSLRPHGISLDFNAGARSLYVHFHDQNAHRLESGGGLLAATLQDAEIDEEERQGSTNCNR